MLSHNIMELHFTACELRGYFVPMWTVQCSPIFMCYNPILTTGHCGSTIYSNHGAYPGLM